MRILFFRTTTRVSGAEIYNLNLLNALKTNLDLDIILLTNSPSLVKQAHRLRIKAKETQWLIKEIGTKKELLSIIAKVPQFLFRSIRKIKTFENKKRIDLIFLQSTTEKIFLSPILYFLKYKMVWIEHGPLYKSEMSRIITWLYTKTSVFANKIIAVSQDTKNDLVQGGVSPQKVKVIYIGVNTEKLKPFENKERERVRAKMHIGGEVKVIGFLGTVTKEKGIEDFLNISAHLIRSGGDFEFLIIGDGPDLSRMKNQVKRLRIDTRYHFVGFVEDAKRYLGIIDILLFPTLHHEGISMAILEAQSMEKIIVTRDIGGNSEIIQNKQNGYLYSQWNNQTISKDIIKLVSDSEFLGKVGKEARKNIVTRFNIKTQVKAFYHLFSSV